MKTYHAAGASKRAEKTNPREAYKVAQELDEVLREKHWPTRRGRTASALMRLTMQDLEDALDARLAGDDILIAIS